MKSFYSRLGFNLIKDSTISPNFEEACKRFDYDTGKYKALQKKTFGLQCPQTIPRRVTILHDNRIEFNENRNVFKDLNEVFPSDYWFPYKYIDSGINKKLDETTGQLAGDEMKKKTKHYVECLNHNPNWSKIILLKLISSPSIVNTFTSS